jgi:apolipoprotein N-acyltransferase
MRNAAWYLANVLRSGDWRVGCGLAVLSGVLYYVGFPGIGFWPCALVAMAPLVIALDGRSPRQGLAIGMIAGMTANVLGFHWLYGTIKLFGGLWPPLAILVVLLLCAYHAGRSALLAWLYRRAVDRSWPPTLAFLSAFVAAELVYPLVIPFFAAASVHGVPQINQLAEFGGPYLVGLVLIAPSLAISEIVLRRFQRLAIRWGYVAAATAVVPLAAAVGAGRMRQVERWMSASQPVRVGLVQGNSSPGDAGSKRGHDLEREFRMSEDLVTRGSEVVVWSEAVVGEVPDRNVEAFLARSFARRLTVPSILGAILVHYQEDGRREYNSAFVTSPNGRVIGRYDKHRLFPFSETIPFAEHFPVLYDWAGDKSPMVSGPADGPLLVDGHRVTVLICYEDILPAYARDEVARGSPEMLVNLTNDVWFGDTAEPWIHLALAQMRAVEHRRYLVRATNSGVSAVVDPVGRVVVQSHTFREEALSGTARWMTGPPTTYEAVGDAPWWAVSAMAGLMALVPCRRLRRKHAASPHIGIAC